MSPTDNLVLKGSRDAWSPSFLAQQKGLQGRQQEDHVKRIGRQWRNIHQRLSQVRSRHSHASIRHQIVTHGHLQLTDNHLPCGTYS